MSEPYDLLLGRSTYASSASSFANSSDDNPTAEKLNSSKKYVVTSTLEHLPWQNSEQLSGDMQQKYLGSKSGIVGGYSCYEFRGRLFWYNLKKVGYSWVNLSVVDIRRNQMIVCVEKSTRCT